MPSHFLMASAIVKYPLGTMIFTRGLQSFGQVSAQALVQRPITDLSKLNQAKVRLALSAAIFVRVAGSDFMHHSPHCCIMGRRSSTNASRA